MYYTNTLRSFNGSLERPERAPHFAEFGLECSIRALQIPVFFPKFSFLFPAFSGRFAFNRTARETFLHYAKFSDNPLNGLIFLWHAAKLCVSETLCSQCARCTMITLCFFVEFFFYCFPCRPFGAMFYYESIENSILFGGLSTLWHAFLLCVSKTFVHQISILVKCSFCTETNNPRVGVCYRLGSECATIASRARTTRRAILFGSSLCSNSFSRARRSSFFSLYSSRSPIALSRSIVSRLSRASRVRGRPPTCFWLWLNSLSISAHTPRCFS